MSHMHNILKASAAAAFAVTVTLGTFAYSAPAEAGVSFNLGHDGPSLGYGHHNFRHGYRHGYRNHFRPHRYFGRHRYNFGQRHYRPYRYGYPYYGRRW